MWVDYTYEQLEIRVRQPVSINLASMYGAGGVDREIMTFAHYTYVANLIP